MSDDWITPRNFAGFGYRDVQVDIERKGAGGFRKSVIYNADGSTAILSTKDGNPQIVGQPKKAPAPTYCAPSPYTVTSLEYHPVSMHIAAPAWYPSGQTPGNIIRSFDGLQWFIQRNAACLFGTEGSTGSIVQNRWVFSSPNTGAAAILASLVSNGLATDGDNIVEGNYSTRSYHPNEVLYSPKLTYSFSIPTGEQRHTLGLFTVVRRVKSMIFTLGADSFTYTFSNTPEASASSAPAGCLNRNVVETNFSQRSYGALATTIDVIGLGALPNVPHIKLQAVGSEFMTLGLADDTVTGLPRIKLGAPYSMALSSEYPNQYRDEHLLEPIGFGKIFHGLYRDAVITSDTGYGPSTIPVAMVSSTPRNVLYQFSLPVPDTPLEVQLLGGAFRNYSIIAAVDTVASLSTYAIYRADNGDMFKLTMTTSLSNVVNGSGGMISCDVTIAIQVAERYGNVGKIAAAITPATIFTVTKSVTIAHNRYDGYYGIIEKYWLSSGAVSSESFNSPNCRKVMVNVGPTSKGRVYHSVLSEEITISGDWPSLSVSSVTRAVSSDSHTTVISNWQDPGRPYHTFNSRMDGYGVSGFIPNADNTFSIISITHSLINNYVFKYPLGGLYDALRTRSSEYTVNVGATTITVGDPTSTTISTVNPDNITSDMLPEIQGVERVLPLLANFSLTYLATNNSLSYSAGERTRPVAYNPKTGEIAIGASDGEVIFYL